MKIYEKIKYGAKKPIFKIEKPKFQFLEYKRLKVDLSQNSNVLLVKLNSGLEFDALVEIRFEKYISS